MDVLGEHERISEVVLTAQTSNERNLKESNETCMMFCHNLTRTSMIMSHIQSQVSISKDLIDLIKDLNMREKIQRVF